MVQRMHRATTHQLRRWGLLGIIMVMVMLPVMPITSQLQPLAVPSWRQQQSSALLVHWSPSRRSLPLPSQ
jgi:hypothetical protein